MNPNTFQKELELQTILHQPLNNARANRLSQLIQNLHQRPNHIPHLLRAARHTLNFYNLQRAMSGSNSNSNSGSNSNSNSNNNVARRNNNMNLHGLYINTNRVKLPANRPIDPISLHKFKKGDAATRIRQNGRNYYFRTRAFNNWFGHNWKTMHPNSNARISNKKHPLTRAFILRRNVSRVKFI
jgi:YHS domain-containing protein